MKLSIKRFLFPFCRKVAMKGEKIRCPSNSIGRFLMQRWVQNLPVAIYSKWVPHGSFHARPHASSTHPLHETSSALWLFKKVLQFTYHQVRNSLCYLQILYKSNNWETYNKFVTNQAKSFHYGDTRFEQLVLAIGVYKCFSVAFFTKPFIPVLQVPQACMRQTVKFNCNNICGEKLK